MALLGEAHPGSISLIRFYAWHVLGLSLVAIILCVAYFSGTP
jgi:quinol-cytochrome oxidoreductase complex cytochrome b subunit